MPIDATSTFDTVALVCSCQRGWFAGHQVQQGRSGRADAQDLHVQPLPDVLSPTDPEVVEVISRVQAGTAKAYYADKSVSPKVWVPVEAAGFEFWQFHGRHPFWVNDGYKMLDRLVTQGDLTEETNSRHFQFKGGFVPERVVAVDGTITFPATSCRLGYVTRFKGYGKNLDCNRTQRIQVPINNDSENEGDEKVKLVVSHNGQGIASGIAVIRNSDPIPSAWTARFGQTVTGQVTNAVKARTAASSQPHVHFAGQALSESPPLSFQEKELSMHDLLDSSFSFSNAQEGEDAGYVSVWGLGTTSGFSGHESALELDGAVQTALLGADWNNGDWTFGLAAGHSRSSGNYTGEGSGEMKAELSGLYPYAAAHWEDRSLWASAGYGQGSLTTIPNGSLSYESNLSMSMYAFGFSQRVFQQENLVPAPKGLSMSLIGDFQSNRIWTNVGRASDGSTIRASDAQSWKISSGIQSTYEHPLKGGATLTPGLDMKLRLDGGDAGKGYGVDVGGNVAFDAPSGLNLILGIDTLLAHEEAERREWNASIAATWNGKETSIPSVAFGMHDDGSQELKAGWRFLVKDSMHLDLSATRREMQSTTPSHGVHSALRVHW